jgi:3-oxoacyl-(acyl-carrier-protein) synthase
VNIETLVAEYHAAGDALLADRSEANYDRYNAVRVALYRAGCRLEDSDVITADGRVFSQ